MNKLLGFLTFLVVVIGILFLFGYLTIDKLLVDECHIVAGVDCEAKVSITAVEFILKNNLNRNLEDFEIYVDICDKSGKADRGGLLKREEEKITIPCYNEVGERFRSELVSSYNIRLVNNEPEHYREQGKVVSRVLE